MSSNKMKIVLFIIIFFLLTAFFIISENKLALKEERKRGEFKQLYSDWLNKTLENFKSVTAHLVKLDWLPDS